MSHPCGARAGFLNQHQKHTYGLYTLIYYVFYTLIYLECSSIEDWHTHVYVLGLWYEQSLGVFQYSWGSTWIYSKVVRHLPNMPETQGAA